MFTFPPSTSHLLISIVIFGDFCDNWFRRKNYHVRSPANRFSPRSGILEIWSTKFENHQSLLAIFFGTDLGFTLASVPVKYPWVRQNIYLQLIMKFFSQLNGWPYKFALSAQFVHVIDVEQNSQVHLQEYHYRFFCKLCGSYHERGCRVLIYMISEL